MSDKPRRQCYLRQASFAELLEDLPASQQQLMTALREQIFSLPADISEVVWRQQRMISFSVMSDSLADNFVFIAVTDAEDQLQLGFYYAAELRVFQSVFTNTDRIMISATEAADTGFIQQLLLAALEQRSQL